MNFIKSKAAFQPPLISKSTFNITKPNRKSNP